MGSHDDRTAREFGGFVAAETLVAQTLARRVDAGFELRHVADREADASGLRRLSVPELRDLARFSESGAFRPLKASPDLRSGWICLATDEAALVEALNHLYPGAVADWAAVRAGRVEATSYREFTGRQTGMYRLTQLLDDALLGETVGTVCAPDNCLKRRLWSAPGLDEDGEENKSVIPCLEPCAPLLEFSRTVMRAEQAGRLDGKLTIDDGETMRRALVRARENPVDDARAADFGSPDNPLRVQLALSRLEAALAEAAKTEGQ